MRSAADEHAADELARAARLERMANELVIEARAIRATYGKQRSNRQRRSMVDIAKSIKEGRV
jgi:hypothetical protein